MWSYLRIPKNNFSHLDPDPSLLIKRRKSAVDQEVGTKPFLIHSQIDIIEVK